MKDHLKFIVLSAIIVFAAACSSGGSKTEATDAREVKSENFDQLYAVNTDKSEIEWEGYKPTGQHNGTIDISNGNLEIKDSNIVGGSFTINMHSIKVLDLKDPDDNAKLTGHLKSADFFEADTYPEATFVITAVKPIDGTTIDKTKEKGDLVPTHAITGNLTMKDQTRSITFNALVEQNADRITAQTNQFFIDRSQWNVKYRSKSFFNDLKDNFINDEMGLKIYLTAERNDEMASR